jgi:hypothetical protein
MTVFQNVRKGLLPARLTVADVYALQEQGMIDEREHFELIEGRSCRWPRRSSIIMRR